MEHRIGKRRRDLCVEVGCLGLSCLLTACASIPYDIEHYTSRSADPTGHLQAGVGRHEITPVPGYPMGGHSLGGRTSRGRWLPLYARAFYFQDAQGHSTALVSCDLFGIPGGLQQKVAQMVNKISPDMSLDNLIISATHTHHGPGNYMTSSFYNSFASPLPGYDPDLVKELAENITAAIKDAIESSRTSSGIELSLTRTDVRDLFADPTSGARQFARNRAVRPLLRAPKPGERSAACDFLGLPQGDCRCAPVEDNCDPEFARRNGIGPDLEVLAISRIEGVTRRRVGQLVFFGMHPTAMSDHNQVYSSDFVGLAMRTIEKQSPDQPFVSAFFNGADGDVSANWGRQDAEDVRALARSLVKAVSLATTPVVTVGPDPVISSARTVRPRNGFCDGNVPMMGVATVGGADDGRFVSFDLGWRAPVRKAKRKDLVLQGIMRRLGFWRLFNHRERQEPKQPGLDVSDHDLVSITDILAAPAAYPTEVPVSVVHIGPIQFLAVPFELTSMTGTALRKELAGTPEASTIVIGLANEYLSYIATESEYQEQEYEGASTLYGPHSAQCLTELVKTISSTTTAPTETRHPAVRLVAYDGIELDNVVLGPGFWAWNTWYSDGSLESPFVDSSPPARWPRMEWSAPRPGRVSVWVEDPTWRLREDDDDGYVLVELATGEPRRWAAAWLRSDPSDHHRAVIAVEAANEKTLCSEPFTLAEIAQETRPSTIPTTDCPF